MPKLTLNVETTIHDWLQSEGKRLGIPAEAVAEEKLMVVHSAVAQLSSHEQDVLNIFKKLDARPGVLQQTRALWINWQPNPASELDAALKSLHAKHLIEGNEFGFSLTEVGYDRIRKSS